jgi:pimeloyl-ACP methyl ester carboxylesterase
MIDGEKRIRAGGLSQAYREAGSGPPLVLIPGIMSSSRFWQPQLAGLSGAFRVIAWDPPGAGGSDDPDEFTGVDGYTTYLATFLAALEASPAHLCGLSWGGILALAFYQRHPNHVASLVLADTYAGWKGSLSAAEFHGRRKAVIADLEGGLEGGMPASIPGVTHPDAEQAVKEFIEQEMREARPGGYRAMGRAILDLDLRAVLPTIRVPTLLIWGVDDERSPLSIAEAIRDGIANAKLVTIPRAGHSSSLERPEAFNDAILGFYQRQRG